MEISKITRDLRAALESDGIEWVDSSSETEPKDLEGWFTHIERTRVVDADGREIAMCTWGAVYIDGIAAISTYGYPNQLDCVSEYLDREPYAMEIADVLIMLAEKERPC